MKPLLLRRIVFGPAGAGVLRRMLTVLSLWAVGQAVQAQAANGRAACPDRLRIAFPDGSAEPFMRGQGEDFLHPPGLLVDWMRSVLRQEGCLERAEMLRLPVRRLRAMIEAGQIDMVAGVGEGGPIAALLTLPPRAGRRGEFDYSLGVVAYALYGRQGSGVRWDGQILSGLAADARVGVTAGTRAEALAKERGWSVEVAPTHESALLKMSAGRTALLLTHSYFVDDRLRRDAVLARQIERLGPVVEQRHLFVGVAPALASSQPVFVQRMWRALCKESSAAKVDGACQAPLAR